MKRTPEKTTIDLYLVKYALSEGMSLVKAEALNGNENRFSVEGRWGIYSLDRDVFVNREDAVRAANVLRLKRIASLKKSLAALEATQFN